MRRIAITLLAVLAVSACGRSASPPSFANRSFDEELSLTVLAGRQQLPDDDRRALLAENHPLLAQIGDPHTFRLVQLFARLPDEAHERLRSESYLKWNVAELDEARRQTLRDLIQLQIDMAARQGGQTQPGFSLEALERAQSGFAVVEIAATRQKVVSWFVLWPELPSPTWVTVVNARAAGTQPYFQAHLERLPLLRSMATSPLPEALPADPKSL